MNQNIPPFPINRRDLFKKAMILGLMNRLDVLNPFASLESQAAVAEHRSLGNNSSPIEIPQGFSCHIVERKGDAMADQLRVPALADGMGAFAGPQGTIILMRNHEIGPG